MPYLIIEILIPFFFVFSFRFYVLNFFKKIRFLISSVVVIVFVQEFKLLQLLLPYYHLGGGFVKSY